mmetsp:Transcript_9849/g.25914  ORF Transcript_9849/g.25914 Transcript_9849/m.25914 type:complete len:265 (-) Transcript_9849:112-906(-)
MLSCNDAILVSSLAYLCVDLLFEWDEFATCNQPVHLWLLVSYVFIVASRMIYVLGALAQRGEVGDFLLNLRPKSAGPKHLVGLLWFLVLPALCFWTAIGSFWIRDVFRHTPACLPKGLHLWFLLAWQLLSYCWILIHGIIACVAWVLERRVRRAESDLQQIEDDDMRTRWGQVSRLAGYTALQGLAAAGLAPDEIRALPCRTVPASMACGDQECPICLVAFKPRDETRYLVGCGHSFHRSCIDLWLLRSKNCPLCKQEVCASVA